MSKKPPENIVLKGVDSLIFEHTDSDNMYYVLNDTMVEFFMDEHGFQWVKYTPSNGMHAGQQHCVPRERIIAVVFKHKRKIPMAPKLEETHGSIEEGRI